MKKVSMKCIMISQHPINKMVSHRILATNRGEKEEILKGNISCR
jgi:transcriptional accessory protein Tex/SPT6